MEKTEPEVRRDRGRRILEVLAMPGTVSIMRHMHMNGWFPTRVLSGVVGMDEATLARHLEALEKVGLVERGSGDGSGGREFRLTRDIPELNLTNLATEDIPFLRCAKFYSSLIFNSLDRASDIDNRLGEVVGERVFRTNGWRDERSRAVLSCFDFAEGPPRTYGNFRRFLADDVLRHEDIDVLKKVSLSMLMVLLRTVEDRTDGTMSRLLMRVASREAVGEFGPEIEEYDLLESIPSEYFRQL